ncbi:MAG: hypothetical protein KatS3mg104_0773 [Phycisphaerae bacterium]|nr:MAG: hypothetical protein KatS3mg104_0773 [Phycisphaerae bacterium]
MIDTAFRAQAGTPQAAVGAMDLVESVARSPQNGVTAKAQVAKRAVTIASETASDSDSMECLRLIEERLKRPAFTAVAETVGSRIAVAVAKRTETNPEVVTRLPHDSYDPGSSDRPSWFLKGIVDGFRNLLAADDSRAAALRLLPNVSSLLFANDPVAERKFVGVLAARRGESAIRESVRAILRDHSTQSTLLRQSILKGFEVLDIDLLDDLTSRIDKDEIPSTMHAIVPHLTNEKVKKIVRDCLVRGFPSEVRRWAIADSSWSADNAAIAAATYHADPDGFSKLLGEPLPDQQKASVLIEYLKPLSLGHFPAWLRQALEEDERVLDLLMSAEGPPSAPGTDEVILQVLRDCDGLRFVHSSRRLATLALHKERSYYSVLVDLTFSDLLKGYVDGSVPESACLPHLQSQTMHEWLGTKEYSSVASLLTHQAWKQKENWLNSWKLMLLLPSSVYKRAPPVVLNSIDMLLRVYCPPWYASVARTWVAVLQRARIECPSSTLALQVQAFRYAIYNSKYPLSEVVIETFKDIYLAVTSSSTLPYETTQLFGIWDWDKGKELRKTLIDTFMGSGWPPGDLALASAEPQTLFRKVFKRIYRKSGGLRYLNAMLGDLDGRKTKDADRMAAILKHLLSDPDFYEDWD